MKKALVLSLALVFALGVGSFAQTLSGSWDTKIGIIPSPVSLTIDSVLNVTYSVSGWSFTSKTTVGMAGWTGQQFDVSGALGAFTIGSKLVFAPSVPSFTSWEVTGGLSIAGVSFDSKFTLTPNNVVLLIGADGSAGNVDVGVDVTFGDLTLAGCDLNWSGVTITIDFPFCCAEISSKIVFTCAGFSYVEFKTTGIQLPGITWATLDATLKFEMQTKSLVVTPKFDFGAVACFDIYLSTPAQLFGDITVNGIGIDCTIGGVDFTGISYWGTGTKPGILKDTPYWEAYQIKTTDDGCCGPFNFDIAVFFLQGGTKLFDVAKIVSNFDIQISTQFTFGMGLTLDLEAVPTFAKWTLHFLVEW
jgi:hypothetical protein